MMAAEVTMPEPITRVLTRYCLRVERDGIGYWLARTDASERFGPYPSAVWPLHQVASFLRERHGLPAPTWDRLMGQPLEAGREQRTLCDGVEEMQPEAVG